MMDKTLADGKSGSTSAPGILFSGSMGPCISIGIYNSKRRRGYMIHQSNPYHDDSINHFLDNIIKKSDLNDLTVYAAGGGIDRSEDEDEDDPHNINDEIDTCRHHVQNLLSDRFSKSQVTIKWNNSARGVELILDTSTGEFRLDYDEEIDED